MPQNWQGPSRGRATRYPHPHQKPAGAGAWPITAGRPEEEAADRTGRTRLESFPEEQEVGPSLLHSSTLHLGREEGSWHPAGP